MKPQNLFDQKMKAVIQTGMHPETQQDHVFSAEYEQKKQQILQQAQRKTIQTTSSSKRRIGIAAAAIVTAALIPTGAYAANYMRGTRIEQTGQYAADLVIEQGTNAQQDAASLIDIGPVQISLSYVPERLQKNETSGKFTYHNPKTPHQGGLSLLLWKLDTNDSEFRMEMTNIADSEEININGNIGVYIQRNKIADNDTIGFDKDALLHIGNSQYVVEVFGGEDITKEEMMNVLKGISLVSVSDEAEAEWSMLWSRRQTAETTDSYGPDYVASAKKSDFTGIHQIDEIFQNEGLLVLQDHDPDAQQFDIQVSGVSIQDNFDGLDESCSSEDFAAYLDEKGNLIPNVRTYYEPGDGVNSLDTVTSTETFHQKIVVVNLTYTNTGNAAIDDICVCPDLLFMQEQGDQYVLYDSDADPDHYYEDSCWALQADGMFYWDMGTGNYEVEKNNICNLQPGASANVQLAFAINEDKLPYMYLFFSKDGSADASDFSIGSGTLESTIIDIRQ